MRLIDADAFKEAIGNDTKIRKMVCSLIDEQPTAYDVDKVVKELEKEQITIISDYTEEYKDVVFLEEAIDIVRKGGICGQCREVEE